EREKERRTSLTRERNCKTFEYVQKYLRAGLVRERAELLRIHTHTHGTHYVCRSAPTQKSETLEGSSRDDCAYARQEWEKVRGKLWKSWLLVHRRNRRTTRRRRRRSSELNVCNVVDSIESEPRMWIGARRLAARQKHLSQTSIGVFLISPMLRCAEWNLLMTRNSSLFSSRRALRYCIRRCKLREARREHDAYTTTAPGSYDRDKYTAHVGLGTKGWKKALPVCRAIPYCILHNYFKNSATCARVSRLRSFIGTEIYNTERYEYRCSLVGRGAYIILYRCLSSSGESSTHISCHDAHVDRAMSSSRSRAKNALFFIVFFESHRRCCSVSPIIEYMRAS
ncbi:unnamed protein product, partial [Trichogramma brassicae]